MTRLPPRRLLALALASATATAAPAVLAQAASPFATPAPAVDATPLHGWLYNKSTGTVKANVPTEADQTGKAYSDY